MLMPLLQVQQCFAPETTFYNLTKTGSKSTNMYGNMTIESVFSGSGYVWLMNSDTITFGNK